MIFDLFSLRGAVVVAAFALAACGGNGASSGSASGAGGQSSSNDAASSTGSSAAIGAGGAVSSGNAASSSNAAPASTSTSSANASTTGAGGAGGGAALASKPPAGTTLCGSGDLMSADIATACASPAMLGSQIPPPSCGLVTTQGGRWEAWCSSTGLEYFWIELYGASAMQDMSMCSPGPGGQDPIELQGGNAGLAEGVFADAQGFIMVDLPSDVAFGYAIPFAQPSGTGSLWITTLLQCLDDKNDEDLTIAGAKFTWKSP